MTSRQYPETAIVKGILAALGRDPRIRIWRNNTGAFRDATGRLVRFGLPGSADITGIMRRGGRRLEIEVKTATGRQTEQQAAFQNMITLYGGVYILARSVDEAMDGVEGALRESGAA